VNLGDATRLTTRFGGRSAIATLAALLCLTAALLILPAPAGAAPRAPLAEGSTLELPGPAGRFSYVDFENQAKPRVGDWVITVGNPFKLGGTAKPARSTPRFPPAACCFDANFANFREPARIWFKFLNSR